MSDVQSFFNVHKRLKSTSAATNTCTRPFWITTSWDDGQRLDQRLADLLDQFGLTGTFYVARDYGDQRLTDAQLAALATRHEVGAHTLTHPMLPSLAPHQAQGEIRGSREWLQEVIGMPVTSFCYPNGAYDPTVQQYVAEAGFELARSVKAFDLTIHDPFALPTAIQVYPFPLRPRYGLRAAVRPLAAAMPHVSRMGLSPGVLRSWPALAIALLGRAAHTGGIWHLWGHSWEIERYGMWDELAYVLTVAAQYVHTGQARCVTNTELVHRLC